MNQTIKVSPNSKKLKLLLQTIDETKMDSDKNTTRALVEFAEENFVYIVDLADAYDERDAEQ